MYSHIIYSDSQNFDQGIRIIFCNKKREHFNENYIVSTTYVKKRTMNFEVQNKLEYSEKYMLH